MPDFIPGRQLCEFFYQEAVRPILDAAFPGLPHSAGLIGSGSEVLGFDTEMSTDHDWGPRVMLFLEEEARARLHESLHAALSARLPPLFRGYRTAFPLTHGSGAAEHRVELRSPRRFFQDYLGL